MRRSVGQIILLKQLIVAWAFSLLQVFQGFSSIFLPLSIDWDVSLQTPVESPIFLVIPTFPRRHVSGCSLKKCFLSETFLQNTFCCKFSWWSTDLIFVIRPNFRAKEFYTLKTSKSRLFLPTIKSINASLSLIWSFFC